MINYKLFVLILLGISVIGCSEEPYCGDGNIDAGESMQTCCEDTGCVGDQRCELHACVEPICGECQYLANHECVDYECCEDTDCRNDEICEDHQCVVLTCDECEYAEDHKCVDYQCCKDEDCRYNEICKEHECSMLTCDYCEYAKNHRCLKQECCSDEECPQGHFCENNKCVEQQIPQCDECRLEEIDSVPIIEYSGDYVYGDSTPLLEFFEEYGDNYDFVTIYTDFDLGGAIHHSNFFLSDNQRLKGYNNMGNLNRLFEGPFEDIYPTNANGILHETGHTWCCYSQFKDWNGQPSSAWLQGGIHWHDQLLDIGTNDPMGGRYHWVDKGDRTLTGTDREYIGTYAHYSDLTLYLMGLLDENFVDPVTLVIPDGEISWVDNNAVVKGELYEISVEDIILNDVAWERRLDKNNPDITMAFIILTKDMSSVTSKKIDKVIRIRELFREQWSIATRGLSTAYVELN